MSDPRSVAHEAIAARRIAELREHSRLLTICLTAAWVVGVALRIGMVAAQIELPDAVDAAVDVAFGTTVVIISIRHARRALRRLEFHLHDAVDIVTYMGLVQAMVRSVEHRLLAAIVAVDGCGGHPSAGAGGSPAVPTKPQARTELRCPCLKEIEAAVHELRDPSSLRHRIDTASVRLLNRFSRISSPPLQFCPAHQSDTSRSALIVTATPVGAAEAELALFALAGQIEIVHKPADAVERMRRRSFDLVVVELEMLSADGGGSIGELLVQQTQTRVLAIGEFSTEQWPSVDLSVADTLVARPATPMELQIAAWELLEEGSETSIASGNSRSGGGLLASRQVHARRPSVLRG